MRTRRYRRATCALALERVRQMGAEQELHRWLTPAEFKRWVSLTASSYPCSCMHCGNPRRHFGERTRQELQAQISEQEQRRAA